MIWMAGRSAARQARRIAARFRLGEAFAGMLLLGIVTSLPEIATTSSAARIGNAALAGSNLLGGVALQMALLAVIDGIALRDRSLTATATGNGLSGQAALLLILAIVATAATWLSRYFGPDTAAVWPLLLALLYVLGVYILYRRNETSAAPASDEETAGTRPAGRIILLFSLTAAAVFAGGFTVAESASVLAGQTGVSASVIGASLVALSTSLPEFTTTFAAVKLGARSMAIGNILGTNALELALFLPADLIYPGPPILSELGRAEIAIGCVNVGLVLALMAGLRIRSARIWLGLGIDSRAMLSIYGAGLVMLALLS